MREKLLRRLFLALVVVGASALAAGAATDTIDFENETPGTIVNMVFGQNGTGPVMVDAILPGCVCPDMSIPDAAVIFDSANPTGADFDLGSPNETCDPPGPGVGTGGEVGQPFENCVAQGNLLIVHEGCADLCAGSPVPDPDDADLASEPFELDFSAVGPVRAESIVVMDVDGPELPATINLYGEGDVLLAMFNAGPTGDNGIVEVMLGPTDGVVRLEVILNGSGAIDNVVFTTQEPFCGDGEVNAPDETCDPPGEPAGEPNECREDCTFCGDGILDDGEECDDGNNENGDGCDAFCMNEPFCGDGEVNAPGETCDPPGEPAGEPNECREDCTFCGDGILDDGEQCDDGNNLPGDGCDPFCMIEMVGEGCTPGYWRQEHHYDSWVNYSPGDSFDAVFGVASSNNPTLGMAVQSKGGGEFALQRHGVAALLNAASPDVGYLYTEAEVIAFVQQAYATGMFEYYKDLLEAQNGDDTFCPLN